MNKILPLFVGIFLAFTIFSCGSVEDYRKLSAETYKLLPEAEKQELMEQLMSAAQKGDDETVKKMFARGVPPDSYLNKSNTPLMEASLKGHLSTVQLLVNRGANVNFQHSDTGFTALMIAAKNKRPEIVFFFVESKANVNLKDKTENTALDYAQLHYVQENVNAIVKAGGTSKLDAEFYQKLRKQNKKQ